MEPEIKKFLHIHYYVDNHEKNNFQKFGTYSENTIANNLQYLRVLKKVVNDLIGKCKSFCNEEDEEFWEVTTDKYCHGMGY